MTRVRETDLRVDVYSRGVNGLQPSTVRITHVPTGIVITETQESQLLGKAQAIKTLEELLVDRDWYPDDPG